MLVHAIPLIILPSDELPRAEVGLGEHELAERAVGVGVPVEPLALVRAVHVQAPTLALLSVGLCIRVGH